MTDGVVLVATGAEKYVALAARAAASVRRHCPGLAVDLFTDSRATCRSSTGCTCSRTRGSARRSTGWLGLALRAHPLHGRRHAGGGGLPRRLRGARALRRRAGAGLAAQLPPAPHVLAQAAAGGLPDVQRRADRGPPQPGHHRVPARPGRAAVKATDTGRDQISLRELLWDSDLRIATLPEEYNLLWITGVRDWTTDWGGAAHPAQPVASTASTTATPGGGTRPPSGSGWSPPPSCRCCSPPTAGSPGCAARRRSRSRPATPRLARPRCSPACRAARRPAAPMLARR